MKLNVKYVESQIETTVTVEKMWMPESGFIAYARLTGSVLVAELDLLHPEQGWRIFPN